MKLVGYLSFIVLMSFSSSGYANEQVLDIYKKYNNLIYWDLVQKNGDADKLRVVEFNKLPETVIETLKLFEIWVQVDETTVLEGQSEYGVLGNDDIFEIINSGKVVGYVLNIATCNSEECSGWDALYLDEKGYVVKQTF